jgi:hypothetical protein
MRASRVTRDRARRFRFDAETGERRESDQGQLVADWVELFPPAGSSPAAVRGAPLFSFAARLSTTTLKSSVGGSAA